MKFNAIIGNNFLISKVLCKKLDKKSEKVVGQPCICLEFNEII